MAGGTKRINHEDILPPSPRLAVRNLAQRRAANRAQLKTSGSGLWILENRLTVIFKMVDSAGTAKFTYYVGGLLQSEVRTTKRARPPSPFTEI